MTSSQKTSPQSEPLSRRPCHLRRRHDATWRTLGGQRGTGGERWREAGRSAGEQGGNGNRKGAGGGRGSRLLPPHMSGSPFDLLGVEAPERLPSCRRVPPGVPGWLDVSSIPSSDIFPCSGLRQRTMHSPCTRDGTRLKEVAQKQSRDKVQQATRGRGFLLVQTLRVGNPRKRAGSGAVCGRRGGVPARGSSRT